MRLRSRRRRATLVSSKNCQTAGRWKTSSADSCQRPGKICLGCQTTFSTPKSRRSTTKTSFADSCQRPGNIDLGCQTTFSTPKSRRSTTKTSSADSCQRPGNSCLGCQTTFSTPKSRRSSSRAAKPRSSESTVSRPRTVLRSNAVTKPRKERCSQPTASPSSSGTSKVWTTPRSMAGLRKQSSQVPNILLEVPAAKRVELVKYIKALGGNYVDSKYFEKTATHVICDVITCSEKFLGACVKGLWILSPKFIEESYQVGTWLEEKDYEYSVYDDDQPAELVSAAKRWRWKVTMFGEQPFSDWQVALILDSRTALYERLLVYGGAKLIKLSLPVRNIHNIQDITYVFMDRVYMEEAAKLLEYGVMCLHHKFIVDTILKDEILDPLQYVIDTGSEFRYSLEELPLCLSKKEAWIVDVDCDEQTEIQDIIVTTDTRALDAVYTTQQVQSLSQGDRVGSRPGKPSSASVKEGTAIVKVEKLSPQKSSTGYSIVMDDPSDSKIEGTAIVKVEKLSPLKSSTGYSIVKDDPSRLKKSKPGVLSINPNIPVTIQQCRHRGEGELNDRERKRKLKDAKADKGPASKRPCTDNLSVIEKTVKHDTASFVNPVTIIPAVSSHRYEKNSSIEGSQISKKSIHSHHSKKSASTKNSSTIGGQRESSRTPDNQNSMKASSVLESEDVRKKTSPWQSELSKATESNCDIIRTSCDSDADSSSHAWSAGHGDSEEIIPSMPSSVSKKNAQQNSRSLEQTKKTHLFKGSNHIHLLKKRLSKGKLDSVNGKKKKHEQISKSPQVLSPSLHLYSPQSSSDTSRPQISSRPAIKHENHADLSASDTSTSTGWNEHSSFVSKIDENSSDDFENFENSSQDIRFTPSSSSLRSVTVSVTPKKNGNSLAPLTIPSHLSPNIYLYGLPSEAEKSSIVAQANHKLNKQHKAVSPGKRKALELLSKSAASGRRDKGSPKKLKSSMSPSKSFISSSPSTSQVVPKKLQASLTSFGFSTSFSKSPKIKKKEPVSPELAVPRKRTKRGLARKNRGDCSRSLLVETEDKTSQPDSLGQTSSQKCSSPIQSADPSDSQILCDNVSLSKEMPKGDLGATILPKHSPEVETHERKSLFETLSDLRASRHDTSGHSDVLNLQGEVTIKKEPCSSPINTGLCTEAPARLQFLNSSEPMVVSDDDSYSDLEESGLNLKDEETASKTSTDAAAGEKLSLNKKDTDFQISITYPANNPSDGNKSPADRNKEPQAKGILELVKQSIESSPGTLGAFRKVISKVKDSFKDDVDDSSSENHLAEKNANGIFPFPEVCSSPEKQISPMKHVSLKQLKNSFQNKPRLQKAFHKSVAKLSRTNSGEIAGSSPPCPAQGNKREEDPKHGDNSHIVPEEQSSLSPDPEPNSFTLATGKNHAKRVLLFVKKPNNWPSSSSSDKSASSSDRKTDNTCLSESDVTDIAMMNASVDKRKCIVSSPPPCSSKGTTDESPSDSSGNDQEHVSMVGEKANDTTLSSQSVSSSNKTGKDALHVSSANTCLPGDQKTEMAEFGCDSLSPPLSQSDEIQSDNSDVESTPSVIKSVSTATDEGDLTGQSSSAVSSYDVRKYEEKVMPVDTKKGDEDETSITSGHRGATAVSDLVVWPCTYPLCVEPTSYEDKPDLPILFGQWMEAARDMDFNDDAISHGKPTAERVPTSLLLSELIQLVQCDEPEVSNQALGYLFSWLEHHPPVTHATIRLYMDAFELMTDSTYLFDIIQSITDESKSQAATLLLEYFITMFEINFDHCLRTGGKQQPLQGCLIIKWLWGSPYAVNMNSKTCQLLKVFEDVILARQLDTRACTAVCALVSMVAECMRLASIRWDQQSTNFATDSVLVIAYDLVKRINVFRTRESSAILLSVLNMLNPPWLRMLVVSIILSRYNDYLLSATILVNNVSLTSIVSQFFFLIPPLEHCSPTELKVGKEGVMHENISNNNLKRTDSSRHQDNMTSPVKNGMANGKLTADRVNKRNGKGESELHKACIKNNFLRLKQLLAVPGVDVNMSDNCGWTPLHEASNHGSYECVELLLKYVPNSRPQDGDEQEQRLSKVNLNAVGPGGVTPLHDAVDWNRVDICRLLLQYGGHRLLEAKTEDGRTAMDFARTDEMKEVLSNFTESDVLLSQSWSQGSGLETMDSSEVCEMALLSSRYKEVVGAEKMQVVSRADCAEFLSLLLILISSYYATMDKVQRFGRKGAILDGKDSAILDNIKVYVTLLRRHVKKLTRAEDFETLQFDLDLVEAICLSRGYENTDIGV